MSDERALYAALLARDADYDGRVYVGVTSTGVFCRLTCPARKPKFENCRFFSSVAACEAAGFRACKRCRPVTAEADADPVVQTFRQALAEDPTRRWTERDVSAMGYDPSTVRRAFRRHFGVTFLEMARRTRLGQAVDGLAERRSVIHAQLDAGFASGSGFRAAFAKLLGAAPGALACAGRLRAAPIKTPLGAMIAVADAQALKLLEFMDRKHLGRELQTLRRWANDDLGLGRFPAIDHVEEELARYFRGEGSGFDTPVAPLGSPFAQTVWRALRRIPMGETRSYGDLARELGRPTAARAVARANATNPIAIIAPCHRVVGADGALVGYGGGLWRKQRLIELERRRRADAAATDDASAPAWAPAAPSSAAPGLRPTNDA